MFAATASATLVGVEPTSVSVEAHVSPGKPVFTLVGLPDTAIREALSGEKEYDIDFRVRWPDGTQRVIKGNGQVIRNAAGKPVRMTGVNYDITDQKRAAQRVALQLAASSVLAEATTLVEATPMLVKAMAEALDATVGAIWEVDAAANALRCINLWHQPGAELADFERTTRAITFAPGVGMPGRVWHTGRPLWIPDISADPNFVNPMEGDFHLQRGSPCIDAGTDVGLPYVGLAPDMGAFEFGP